MTSFDPRANDDAAIGFSDEAVADVSSSLTAALADVFALYVKTKNFHWHVSGPHFRDYHHLFDEQAGQIEAMIDPLAERARKVGGTSIRSIGHIARLSAIADSDGEDLTPHAMICELRRDNAAFAGRLRQIHALCDEHGDVASASLIENWLDETEGRIWFLAEIAKSNH